MKIDTLNNLSLEESALIIENKANKDIKKNLTNLGLSKNNKIKCLYRSPFKDPTAYQIKNVILAIREEDAKKIVIEREENGSN